MGEYQVNLVSSDEASLSYAPPDNPPCSRNATTTFSALLSLQRVIPFQNTRKNGPGAAIARTDLIQQHKRCYTPTITFRVEAEQPQTEVLSRNVSALNLDLPHSPMCLREHVLSWPVSSSYLIVQAIAGTGRLLLPSGLISRLGKAQGILSRSYASSVTDPKTSLQSLPVPRAAFF